jgi:hypothetical protein
MSGGKIYRQTRLRAWEQSICFAPRLGYLEIPSGRLPARRSLIGEFKVEE